MRVAELTTGRVMKRFAVPGGVSLLRWNPSVALGDVLAVVGGNRVYFVDTEVSGNEETHRRCVELLRSVRRVGDGGRCECRRESARRCEACGGW